MKEYSKESWQLKSFGLAKLFVFSGGENICDINLENKMAHGNSERIIDCVNACAGMDDPVMEIQRLKNKSYSMRGGLVSEAKSRHASGQETLNKLVDDALLMVPERPNDFSNIKNYGGLAKIPSWHELGILPPVGTECEMKDDKDGWLTAEIIAHKSRYAFGWCAQRDQVYFSAKPDEFRPIQTEKQKTIAAMLPIVAALDGTQSQAEIACEKIYDNFLSDKKEK